MRSQYLGFFFTAILGVTALAGPRLAADSLRTSGDLVTVAALALGAEILAGFLYISVNRVNEVVGHYTDQIESMSTWMAEQGAALDLAAFIKASKPRYRWAGTSGSAQAVLKGSVFGLPWVSAAILARALDVSGPAAVVVCCALALVLSGGVLIGVLLAGPPRDPRQP
jgi:hypothetical protein